MAFGSPLETGRFIRKTFVVEAVQVKTLNMHKVADWCGGRVVVGEELNGDRPHILLKFPSIRNLRIERAYVRDWILKIDEKIKIWKPEAFAASFRPVSSEDDERIEQIQQLIHAAMMRQDMISRRGGTTANADLVSKETAKAILNII